MLFCIVNSVVVYLFADTYIYVINCPSYKMNIITLKWTLLLITTLPTTKQLQYWCLEVCNVIQLKILWNYNDWCWFKSIQINVMMVEIDVYDTIGHKFDVNVSATVEYEFTVVIFMINGSVTPQAIGMKVNIIKQKGQGIPSLISPSDDNQNDDASSGMSNVLNIEYHTVIVAGTFLTFVLEIEFPSGIGYDLDAADPIILAIESIISNVTEFWICEITVCSNIGTLNQQNGIENWISYIFLHEPWLKNHILSIRIIITCEFHIILIYLAPKIRQECNNNIEYTTKQKSIFKIILWINMDAVYQHSDNISNRISCIRTILMITNITYSICTNELYANNGGGYGLNQNKIIQCRLNKNISTINYNQFVSQVYSIDDIIHDLKVIITIIDVSDTIEQKVEVTVAIHVIIGKASLFVSIHGTVALEIYILVFTFNAHSTTASLFLFYLIKNNTDDIDVIIFIIHAIATIICSFDRIYVILFLIDVINVVLIRTLYTKISNGYILNTNKIITTIIIHYDKSDANICRMNYFDVIITITNGIGIIIDTINVLVVIVILEKISLFDICDAVFDLLGCLVFVDSEIKHCDQRTVEIKLIGIFNNAPVSGDDMVDSSASTETNEGILSGTSGAAPTTVTLIKLVAAEQKGIVIHPSRAVIFLV